MNAIASVYGRAARLLVGSLYDNPVVVKELRTRMRGLKAFVVMGAYVLFLAAILLITYAALWAASHFPGGQSLVNQKLGLHLFGSLVWTQTILLSLIVPALASGALTAELESKTIELLALTRLTPGRIVLGKLLSSFLYSMMLLVISLPLAGICLAFGGISPVEAAAAYALLVAWTFLLASVGMFWSSLFNRTVAASLLTYGACGLYLLFISGLGSAMGFYALRRGVGPVFAFIALSPGLSPMLASLKAEICGIRIPIAVISFVLHAALSVLLLLVASTHVRHKRADKAIPIRLLLLGIAVGVCWVLLGDRASSFAWYPAGRGGPLPSNPLLNITAVSLAIAMILLGAFSSIFATGPLRKKQGDSLFHYVFPPFKAFKADLGGAISFMLLWTALMCGAIGVTVAWAAKAYGVSIPSSLWVNYSHMCVVVVMVVAALSAIGILISSVLRRRRDAVALVLLILIIMFTGYVMIQVNYMRGISNPDNPIWQLAALWPLTPILAESGNWDKDMPDLLWSPQDSWIIVGIMYAFISVAALMVASVVSSRRPGIQEE